MKKILVAAVAVAVMSLPAFAGLSRFSLAVQGGMAGQEENNLRPGLETGVGLAFDLGGGLSLNAEVAFWESRSRTSFRKLYDGTLSLAPVSLSVRYEFRPNAYFIPYVLAGATYVFTKYRPGPNVSLPPVQIEQRVNSGTALHIGLGARIPLTWRLSFCGETVYIMRRASGQTIVKEPNQSPRRDDIWVNLHIVLVKFGLRFDL